MVTKSDDDGNFELLGKHPIRYFIRIFQELLFLMCCFDLNPFLLCSIHDGFLENEDENCHIVGEKAKYFESKKIMSASGIP